MCVFVGLGVGFGGKGNGSIINRAAGGVSKRRRGGERGKGGEREKKYLGQERVVVPGDDVAGRDGAVEADARAARHAVRLEAAAVGLEVLLGVLARDAALEGGCLLLLCLCLQLRGEG